MESKLRIIRKKKSEAENAHLDPLMRALKALHSAGAPESMTAEELERQRRSQEVLGKLTAPMTGMDYEEFALSGMSAAWTRLKAPHGSRHAILYCHGGGYTSGNLGYSRVLSSKLAHATGYDVLSFEYRLAPEFPYPAAAEDALRAWDYLMLQGYGARDIVLAGDSAGGNLALVLCNRLKAAGRKLPGALILMSPWTDMTMSGQSYTERAEIDPMLTPEYIEAVRLAYAAGRDYRSSDLSPLFADFTGFPPTLIQVGDHEILYSDSEQLYQAMKRANVPCRLQVSEGMWHVFQMFPIRKASVAIENIARFLLEQSGPVFSHLVWGTRIREGYLFFEKRYPSLAPSQRKFTLQASSSKSCGACRLHFPARGVAALGVAIRFDLLLLPAAALPIL